MRQAIRKTLSALVVLTLILLVIPSLAGHTASAATLIDKGQIYDLDLPVAGAAPDYTATISYSVNMMKFQNLSGDYYKNGIGWRDETAGEMVKHNVGYTFIDGHTYTVIISLDAKSGYTFSSDGSTVYTKGYIDGFSAKTKYLTDTRIEFRYTFPTARKTRISSVTITGVTAPKVGSKPVFSATVSGSGFKKSPTSGWYTNGVGWCDQTTGSMMKSSDTFQAGHTYRVIVSLVPDATYTFGTKDDYTPGTINGNKVHGVNFWSDGSRGYYYDFAPEGVVPNVIITKLDPPEVGKTPDYSINYGPSDKVTYDTISTDNWSNGVIWYDETAGGASIAKTDKFLEGHKYRVRISLYTKTGYTFCDSNGNVATKGTINGLAAATHAYNKTNVGFDYTFPTLDKIVRSVTITGLDAPAIGKTPDYTVTVSGTGAELSNYTSGAWKNGVQWFNETDSKYVYPTDKFEAGKVYTVEVNVKPKSGYTVWQGDDMAVKATINGMATETPIGYEDNTIGIEYTFAELKTLISSVTITDIDAPVIGKTPDYNITAKGTGFINDTYANDYWKNGINWYDMTADKAVKTTDKFQAGHSYRVRVSLYAKSGYTFKDATGNVATKVTINGKDASGSNQFSDPENLGFDYVFPALAKVATGVAIKDIDAPAAGKKPDYNASGSGDGYYVESDYTSGTMWRNGVEWYDVTSSSWVNADTDTFIAGHQYKVVVSMKAKSGYFFDSTSTATINGKTAEIYDSWSTDNYGFSYTFDALPAADKLIDSVTITGVTAPVAGEKPNYNATVSGVGFTLEDYNSSCWVHGVIWHDSTDDTDLVPDDTFKAGHAYRIGFSLLPSAGYTFKDESGDIAPMGTINGELATETYAYSDGTVAYRYEFPKLAEAAPEHLFPVDFYGFATYEGGLFYVYKGDVVTDANGLVNDPNNPADWYFCANGQAQLQYSGLAEYGGEWFYLENGKLNTARVGIVTYDGGRFMIAAGRILREVNGLIQDPNTGLWYYVAAGQVADYTGLVQYDGAWFYVINGELATGYTGPVEYNGATFQVVNGQMVA